MYRDTLTGPIAIFVSYDGVAVLIVASCLHCDAATKLQERKMTGAPTVYRGTRDGPVHDT